MLFLALALFVLLLSQVGRIGPFVWDGPRPRGCPARPFAAPAASDPARILARRLADGEVTPEEYLERLSLINER